MMSRAICRLLVTQHRCTRDEASHAVSYDRYRSLGVVPQAPHQLSAQRQNVLAPIVDMKVDIKASAFKRELEFEVHECLHAERPHTTAR